MHEKEIINKETIRKIVEAFERRNTEIRGHVRNAIRIFASFEERVKDIENIVARIAPKPHEEEVKFLLESVIHKVKSLESIFGYIDFEVRGAERNFKAIKEALDEIQD